MAFDKSRKYHYDNWLQTEFAADLVQRLTQAFEQSPTEEVIETLRSKEDVFNKWRFIPDLWVPRWQLLTKIGELVDGKGNLSMVMASSPLIAVLKKLTNEKGSYKWPEKVEHHDPVAAFNALLRWSFRRHNSIFVGPNSPTSILETCEHIFDKAYVRAVIIAL